MVRQEGPEHVSSRPNSDLSGMSAAWSLRGKVDMERTWSRERAIPDL